MVFERMRAFFRRNRLDDELAEEIRLHIELRRDALVADGMAADDAEREARRQFGNVTAIRERAREEWIRPWIASIVQDVRFATRLMTRSPGLSAVVVLTVAVGAGVNAALFFALNNMLLRSPELPDAGHPGLARRWPAAPWTDLSGLRRLPRSDSGLRRPRGVRDDGSLGASARR